MAMRQTPKSGGASTSPSAARRSPRPPVAVHSAYENFKPTVDWQEDEESNTLLLIYLPGFQRENLKVSTEGRNILRVRGETLIAGNKWRKFQEDYPLSEDCNVRGIRAKFESGTLTIIIPKKKLESFTEPNYKPSSTTAPQKNQLRPPQQQKPAAAVPQQQDAGNNYIAGPSGIPSAKKARATAGITQDRTTSTPAVVDQRDMSREKEEPEKNLKEKQQESDYKKEAIEKTMGTVLNDQKVTTADDGVLKMKDIKKSEQGSDYDQNKKNKTDSQEIKRAHHDEETKDQKHKLEKKDEGEIIDQKEWNNTTKTEQPVATSGENYKQTVRKFMELKEERKLLMNVGAAVLVIVAFGAYLSYTIIN